MVIYIEVYGIVFLLVDVIEMGVLILGLSQFELEFLQEVQEEVLCYISSLKLSIGYGELVFGMVVFMKVSMVMKY